MKKGGDFYLRLGCLLCFFFLINFSTSSFNCFGIESTEYEACNNGTCTGNDTCSCYDDFYGEQCEFWTCFGIMNNLTESCNNGSCIGNNTCMCSSGYEGSNCEDWRCDNILHNDQSACSGNGTCIGPDDCDCSSGYFGENCELWNCSSILKTDPSSCSGENGTCISPDNCLCWNDHEGDECETWRCNTILHSNIDVCSGNGTCISPDYCGCFDDYEGSNCEDWRCNNILHDDESVCSNNGTCIGPNNCECSSGYFGDNCELWNCSSILKTDSSSCSGENGTCIGPDNCLCWSDHEGNECETWRCNTILESDNDVCSGNGTCISPDYCGCFDDYEGTNCEDWRCDNILHNDESVCSNNGTCIGPNNCDCSSGYFGDNCELWNCSSILKTDPSSCSGENGTCISPNNCLCWNDHEGDDCETWRCNTILQSNIDVCSGNGTCISPDYCGCFDDYEGSNCEDWRCYNILHDDPSVCSGNGTCLGPDTCMCSNNYFGDNCEYWNCSDVPNYDSSSCSGENGTCIGPDDCLCSYGHQGSYCQYWECFGFLNNNPNVCSGEGQCVDVDVCMCLDYQGGSNCSESLPRCIEKCGIGEYYSNCTDKCYSCLPGHYCSSFELVSCEVGKYNPNKGSSTLSSCITCENGYYSSSLSSSNCLPCDEGYECTGGISSICSNGYYSNVIGQSECFPCPNGHSCTTTVDIPSSCVIGSFNDHVGGLDSGCSVCSAGKFSLSKGSIDCFDCETGFICENGMRELCGKGTFSSSNVCQECENGSFNIINGSVECFQCPKGYQCSNPSYLPSPCDSGSYNPLFGQVECMDCSNSQYTIHDGSTECFNCENGMLCNDNTVIYCPQGTFSTSNDTICNNCTSGYYCIDPSNSPVECGKGEFSKGSGMILTCEACPDGYYANGTGMDECILIPAGYFLIDKSNNPEMCDVGSFSTAGSSFCSKCNLGTYQTSRGSSYCNGCPAGSKCPDPTISPIECEEGFISSENSTICVICDVGTYSSNDRTECIDCEPGFMCPNPVLGRIECSEGYFSSGYNSISCVESPSGYYASSSNATTECESGYSFPAQTRCFDCPAGMDCSDHTKPIPCSEGYYSEIGIDTCTICPAGKKCFKDKVLDCKDGFYSFEGSRNCSLCPPGFKCENGNAPISCSNIAGSAEYSEAGSITCIDCPSGFKCPFVDELPIPCNEGSYSDVNSKYCYHCSAGMYCEDVTSSSSSSCSAGEFSFPGMKNCIQCPAGFYCGSKVNFTHTVCPNGTYSVGGLQSCNQVGLGEYSETPDEGPKKCPVGTYTPTTNQVECTLVEKGYYSNDPSDTTPQLCPIGTWSSEGSSKCFPCGNGFFCNPSGSFSPNDIEKKCPIGSYCPPGTNTIVNCPNGKYGKFEGMDSEENACEICPAGFICPSGSFLPLTSCSSHSYCPVGSYSNAQFLCTNGFYQNEQGSKIEGDCLVCEEGSACVFSGGITVQTCAGGFYCPEGSGEDNQFPCPRGSYSASTSNTQSSDCQVCDVGSFCRDGSTSPVQCKQGTYNPSLGASGGHECMICPAGYSCDSDGLSSYSNCSVGYYCPPGSRSYSDYPCPEGTFSDEINLHRIEDCRICPEGYSCGKGISSLEKVLCPIGYYCPGAQGDSIQYYGDFIGQLTDFGKQFPCPKGTYGSQQGLTHRENCTVCPSGKYCVGGKSFISGNCSIGYYCPSGSFQSQQVACPEGTYLPTSDGKSENDCIICPVGHYCLEGTSDPFECEPGSYYDEEGAKYKYMEGYSEGCKLCPGGFYCISGQIDPSPCENGYFSDEGSSNCTLCEPGYYCVGNSSRIEMHENNICDGGFFCSVGTSIIPDITILCSQGNYCPRGTPIEISCPKGTYNPIEGKSSVSECIRCDEGSYCLKGSSNPSGTCSPGYFCPVGSIGPTQNPCPEGTYIDENGGRSSNDCLTCPEGKFCEIGCSQPIDCPVGFYCELGSKEATPCPIGTYSNSTNLIAEEYCILCPEGMYCSNLGITFPSGDCDAGYYCSGRSTTSKPSDSYCPKGSYCPSGSPYPFACNPGTYNNFTGGKSIDDCVLCPEGYYCASSNGFVPTGECLAGYYCEEGSTSAVQFATSKGFYSSSGSSNPIPCDKGSFADEVSSSECNPCTAGYYCPDLNMDSVGPICPKGYYCPESTPIALSCPPGTFSFNEGNQDISDCEDCLPGYYCEGSGLKNTTAQCSAGFYCSGGSVEATPVNKDYGDLCPPGYYCEIGSDLPTPCTEGTFNPSFGRKSITECISCLPGFYCPEKKMTNSTLPCAEGYYCISRSSSKTPVDGIEGNICPLGYYCPEESSSPIPCNPGYFTNVTGKSECDDCPEGYYCPFASYNPIPCPVGKFCPINSHRPKSCPIGTYRDVELGKSEDDCFFCSGGWFCGIEGLYQPQGYCLPGYFCNNGCVDNTGNGMLGGICPKGFFCPRNSTSPQSCPIGTFNPNFGGSEYRSCLLCPPGHYCNDTGLFEPVGLCTEGFFCNTGSKYHDQEECPTGSYCESGSSHPKPCFDGFYQDTKGESSCKLCPEGFFCTSNTSFPEICPKGSYCETGSGHLTLENGCPMGTFGNVSGLESSNDCFSCLDGKYCSRKGLQNPDGSCSAGYYCDGGAIDNVGREEKDDDPKNCWKGYFCLEESAIPSPCPVGTFSSKSNLISMDNCEDCTAGKFCSEEGILFPSGNCSEGYYCSKGAYVTNPTDGSTGNICPKGFFCPEGSGVPQPCLEGTFANNTGLKECDICPERFYCPSLKTISPIICPKGRFCPEGTGSDVPKCPGGSYNDEYSLKEQSECKLCGGGKVCSLEGLENPNLDCEKGYVCIEGSIDTTGNIGILGGTIGGICEKGMYCPEGVSVPQKCPNGTKNGEFGLWSSDHCEICNGGKICDEGDIVASRICEEGYYCPSGSAHSEFKCPPGYYCPAGSSFPIGCGDGLYQNNWGRGNCDSCTGGSYCLNNCSYPIECPIEFYCPIGTGYPIRCPNGTFGNVSGLESDLQCTICPPGKYCAMGKILGDCYAGYICYEGNPEPTPLNDLPVGDLCPAGFFCTSGTQLPTPCPNGTVGVVKGGFSEDICGICDVGYKCDSSQSVTLPNGITLITSIAQPCPKGYYCPLEEQPIPCKIGTFNNMEYGKNESDCRPCLAGYNCNEMGIGMLEKEMECDRGYFCIEGTPASSPPIKCGIGTFNNFTGGTSSVESCLKCTPGYYCDKENMTTPLLCKETTYCPLGSYEEKDCPPRYYCPEGTDVPIPCPPGFFCIEKSSSPKICPYGHFCPASYELPIPCPLGYLFVGNTSSSTSLDDSCLICAAGTYGIHNRSKCNICNEGYVCLEGTTSPFPVDKEKQNGYECPSGHYCPIGSAIEIPCPKGYYQKEKRQSICEVCPVNHYNDVEGQSYCSLCGSNAVDIPSRTSCRCIGNGRSYQKSDGNCLCYPGYALIEENVMQENKDSNQDCQQIVYDPCSTSGNRRNAITGKCEAITNCESACSFGNRTIKGFISTSGICECQEIVDENEICDSECRRNQLRVVFDGSEQKFKLFDPISKKFIEEYSISSLSNIACDGKCNVEIMDINDNGIKGIFDVQIDLLYRIFNKSAYGGMNNNNRRSLSLESGDSKGIYSPLVCLNYGEGLLFSVSCENERKKHYPQYLKDSLLNTNKFFDYGDFRLLENHCKSNLSIDTFVYIFKDSDSPGVYVFYDAGNTDKIVVVQVMEKHQKCPSQSQFRPITSSNLVELGIGNDEDIRLTPDWVLIICLFVSFILFFFVFVGSVKYLYSSSGFKNRITKGKREIIDLEMIKKYGLLNEEMKKLYAIKEEDENENIIDLEDFDVEEFYSILFGHTKEMYSNIEDFKEGFFEVYNDIMEEADSIKGILKKKYGISDINVEDYMKKVYRYKEQLNNEEFEYNENLMSRIIGEFKSKLKSLKELEILKGDNKLVENLNINKDLAINECERAIQSISNCKKRLQILEKTKNYDSIEEVNRQIIVQINNTSSRLVKYWKKISDCKRKLEKGNVWNSFQISSKMSRTLKNLLNKSLAFLRKKFEKKDEKVKE